MENEMVPPEIKGKNTDLERCFEAATVEAAISIYKMASERMLDPFCWHKLCGPASAEFALMDEKGEPIDGPAKRGDHLRIDIPGPGTATGGGYDWVRVEFIEEISNPAKDEESCGMKVRAASAPGKEQKDTAHFFKTDATSSFIVHRSQNRVTASYHGRNEIPNTSTGNTADNIRNTMVAMGAIAGFSEVQWSTLTKGFLKNETG